MVDPITGNVLLGSARLNLPDGLWTLYNVPWQDAPLADYDTPHSSFTYVFDAEGAYEAHFGMAVTAQEMAARLSEPHARAAIPGRPVQ